MGILIDLESLKIDKMICTGLWEQMQSDLEENQTPSIEEQITKMKDLIGYQDPPKFKFIKGGLE